MKVSAGPFFFKMHKIIFCSDLHGNERIYEVLFEKAKDKSIKAILIGGDICPHFRGPINMGIDVQQGFLKNYLIPKAKKFDKELFIMMGNDDFRANLDVMKKAEKDGVFNLLDSNVKKIHNFFLVGYSFVNPHPFLLKDWEKPDYDDSEVIIEESRAIRTAEKANGTIIQDLGGLKRLSNPKKTIYVMHAPPFNTKLDASYHGQHFGSKAIKEFINKEQPPLTLHGHVHESSKISSWRDEIGKTICLNPGSDHFNSKLNYVIIDLDNLEDIKHFSEV